MPVQLRFVRSHQISPLSLTHETKDLLDQTSDADVYVRWAREHIDTEMNRASRVFDSSTNPKLHQLMIRSLVVRHMDRLTEMESGLYHLIQVSLGQHSSASAINSFFVHMPVSLSHSCTSHTVLALKHLYTLLNALPPNVDILRTVYSQCLFVIIKPALLNEVEVCKDADDEARVFVDSLMSFWSSHTALCKNAFANTPSFIDLVRQTVDDMFKTLGLCSFSLSLYYTLNSLFTAW